MNTKQTVAIALTLIIAIPILAGYAFASETTTKTQTVTESTVSLSDQLLNSDAYYYNDYTGPANNGALLGFYTQYTRAVLDAPDYVSTGTNETSVLVGSVATHTLTLDSNDYVDIEITAGNSEVTTWTFESYTNEIHLKITHSDDTVTYADLTASPYRSVARYGSAVYVGSEVGGNSSVSYFDVSSVAVMIDNAATLSIDYYAPGTVYADVSAGWSTPNSYGWANGYLNRSVVFYLHMDTPASGSESASFDPYLSLTEADSIGFEIDSSGVMTINSSVTLGTYNDVQIVYDCYDHVVTVSGISAWPAMGATPATLNVETFDTTLDSFTFIEIDDSTGTAVWRCDNAEIAAGTFPVTENYTLSMAGLFPDKEYNVKLNSIGIYGDTLTIAGTSYAVTDGTITVNNESVKLKGMEIEVTEDGGTWSTSVNGDQVASGSSAPTVVFGGVWSLTATADILKDVTVTSDEWKPGAFAFDKDNFILMLLLCSVAVFVALGFTAGRSGGKALALIVTCGGAAVIALMMV